MTMPDTEDYIVFDRTGTPYVVVAVDIVNAYAEAAKALLRSPDPYTDRVDVAPGFDSIRPEKWAENETKAVPHDIH